MNKQYLKKRALEPSTWLGLLQFCIAFAVIKFTPEQSEAVTQLVYIIFGTGAAGVILPDKQHGGGDGG